MNNPVIPTRALENGIFAAYSNRIGSEESLTYVGGSCVVAPDGKDLARRNSDEEGLIVEKIKTAALDAMRS